MPSVDLKQHEVAWEKSKQGGDKIKHTCNDTDLLAAAAPVLVVLPLSPASADAGRVYCDDVTVVVVVVVDVVLVSPVRRRNDGMKL